MSEVCFLKNGNVLYSWLTLCLSFQLSLFKIKRTIYIGDNGSLLGSLDFNIKNPMINL